MSLSTFRTYFSTLAAVIDDSEYRKALVDITREYAGRSGQAAD